MMIECRSRDADYCREFGIEIKEDRPCRICPHIEKPKKDDKKEGEKDG